MEGKEYTIEEVEKKTKELQQESLRIGFMILNNESKGVQVEESDFRHQEVVVRQYKFFKSMLAEMRKEQKEAGKGNDGVSALFGKLDNIELGVKQIQQKIK